MSDFWEKKLGNKTALSPASVDEQMNIALDEQAIEEAQQDDFDVFQDEEEDTQSLMTDANLRLEQGRLYQMVLQNDIFGETNADPKAIRNVQREIRKFVRERMETMLGIRQEAPQQTIVSLPFNDMEVTVLKMFASKMSKGATEQQGPSVPTTPAVPAPPKRDGITAISGNLRPKETNTPLTNSKPAQKQPVPVAKKAVPAKSALTKPEESFLQKPIDQMSPQELAEHNKAAEERSLRKYAQMPTNMLPHPSPQSLEMLYTQSASNLSIANPWRSL